MLVGLIICLQSFCFLIVLNTDSPLTVNVNITDVLLHYVGKYVCDIITF